MSHDTSLREQRDLLEGLVNDVEGLVAALELVSWEFGQTSIEDPTLLNLRKAVIAISSSMDRTIQDRMQDYDAQCSGPDRIPTPEAAE